jgi:hypothetical protein
LLESWLSLFFLLQAGRPTETGHFFDIADFETVSKSEDIADI